MTRQNRKGFTLIEILIVVIILGILAAIVIPQFTNASQDAKRSSLVTMVQSLRSQIALYKLQHNDVLPGGTAATPPVFSSDQFWSHMTEFTAVDGTFVVGGAKTTTYAYGPYMQAKAKNPLCPTQNGTTESTVTLPTGAITNNLPPAAGAACGFIYDFGTGGDGSGRIWGTDTNGTSAVAQ